MKSEVEKAFASFLRLELASKDQQNMKAEVSQRNLTCVSHNSWGPLGQKTSISFGKGRDGSLES